MVKYYYDRYNAIPSNYYSEASWETSPSPSTTFFVGYAKSYSFDPTNNTYSNAGGTWQSGEMVKAGDSVFMVQSDMVTRYTAQHGGFPATEYFQCTLSYKYTSKSSSRVVYSKGTLVQAGIVAEDGTYPADGPHTDGYWYVKGAVVNTAPTMPGAFTQPSGNLEIGDSKVFAVGAASDAEGNLSKYIWEASINGGSFSKVGETTANSLAYTIPTATSLKMRVKAVDLAGLESAYRESSLYNVQPPQYYYDKYNSVPIERYNDDAAYVKTGHYSVSFSQLAKSYTFDPVNNKYTKGTDLWKIGEGIGWMGEGYDVKTGVLYKYECTQTNTFVGSSNNAYENIRDPAKNTKSVTEYGRGTLVQTGIIGGATTYPMDGRHTDGFWYVRKSRVNQSIAPPTPFTSPTTGKKFKPSEAATITFGASNAANLSLYEVDYRYNAMGAWTPLAYNNTLTRSLTITTDKTLKTLELRVRAKNTSNVYSDYVYSEPFEIEHNVAPTVSLTGPGDNSTLYENDTLTIGGTAYDADPDQAVTVYYQINAEPRKVLTTNLSKVQIALSKQLTFKAGKIYDGETVLTETLAAGIEHKLKVWAIDSENATSVVVERTFFVVPNRAPLLSLDAIVPSGVVDVDKFKISGTASDEDANSTVKVTRKINSGDPVEIYSGQGGAWEFDLSLAQLIVGENTIIIEVIDNYGAKTSKTIKLKKNEVKTPILHAVARYKITPPAGSAKGVLLFIERDEEMELKVELSMTLAGEQEQYETLTASNTAPMPNTNGIIEDTYYHETTEPKDNIILKLSTTRPDVNVNHKIHLISGAVE